MWDYHALAIHRRQPGNVVVYDLDTALESYPCRFDRYMDASFKPEVVLKKEYQPQFRVVSAADFLLRFTSDRSHMRKNGEWQAPPPTYDPIVAPGADAPTNLEQYIQMEHTREQFGTVYDLRSLLDVFSS